MLVRARAGGVIVVYGDGAQLRDYVYIDDVTDALLHFGAHDARDVLVNVGSGEGRPFAEAAHRIAERCGVPVEHVDWPDDARRVESGDFVADISRARISGTSPPGRSGLVRQPDRAVRAGHSRRLRLATP